MAKSILRQTETLAVIKFWGTGTTDTLSLATDLLSPTMEITGTPEVNVIFAAWNISSGASDTITVTRNSVPVLNLFQNAGELDLGGNGGVSDNIENISDFTVNIVGTGNLYLTVRKAAGYASKVEPEFFSVYDNTNAVGS